MVVSLDVGTGYTPSFAITNLDGSPATATAATLVITQPDQTPGPGQTITLPPATPGLLVPAAPFVPVQAGLHKFAWAVTLVGGFPLTKTDYESFRNFTSAVSLDAARDRLGRSSTVKDERLRLYMGAATHLVEKRTGILVPRTFTLDWITGTYRDVLRVPRPPILPSATGAAQASVTALRSAYPPGPSWDPPTQLLVNPAAGTIRHVGLIPFWYGPWLCTYVAGRPEVPEPVVEGVLEVVFDLWQSTRGLSADLAEAAAQEALIVPPYYKLPPRALALIKDYEQPGIG